MYEQNPSAYTNFGGVCVCANVLACVCLKREMLHLQMINQAAEKQRKNKLKSLHSVWPAIRAESCQKLCTFVLILELVLYQRNSYSVLPTAHRQKHLVVTCLECNVAKRFVTISPYSLWCEQEEAKHKASHSVSTNQIDEAQPPGKNNTVEQQRSGVQIR